MSEILPKSTEIVKKNPVVYEHQENECTHPIKREIGSDSIQPIKGDTFRSTKDIGLDNIQPVLGNEDHVHVKIEEQDVDLESLAILKKPNPYRGLSEYFHSQRQIFQEFLHDLGLDEHAEMSTFAITNHPIHTRRLRVMKMVLAWRRK
jgi:hypothetical protein